jgi:antitoxin ParD1/3/4
MPTRNVVLTERQAIFVERLVREGRFQNASEVLRQGLRLLEEHEAQEAAKLVALRDAAQAGIAALGRGDYRVFPRGEGLDEHLETLTESAIESAEP